MRLAYPLQHARNCTRVLFRGSCTFTSTRTSNVYAISPVLGPARSISNESETHACVGLTGTETSDDASTLSPKAPKANQIKKSKSKATISTGKQSSKVTRKGIVADGSEKHQDLKSFLEYAHNVDLDRLSTVYVGTHYEYTVAEVLRKFDFALTRTGRSSDRGIDLLGQWRLPTDPNLVRVMVQCKVVGNPGPALVRELEGSFVGAPAGWQGEGVLALLAASKKATKGIRDAMTRSRWPMGFLNISTEGKIRQFIWNQRAADGGLEGVGTALKHSPAAGGDDYVGGIEQEITLTWRDRPWKTKKRNMTN